MKKPTKTAPKPWTLPHFREWISELVLDDGSKWKLEPFQEAFIKDLFAGFLEAWFILPEGSGKTTLVAGLALYHCEFKASASVPVAASSRDQAEILYGQAEGLVLRTPRLAKIFKCLPGYRRIICKLNRSRIQVWAADERTGDGVIPTLAITEELHRHRDLKLYRTWRGKVKKRGGQIIAISTAGEPGSEFEQTRTRMRESGHDVTRETCFTRAAAETTIIHDWAVPEKADVEDLAVVKAANPFSGVTIASLREDRASATMTLDHWSRFKCNRPTRSVQSAITEAEWAAAATDVRIPEGEPIAVGVDSAWKWDCFAIVPLWVRDAKFRLLGPAAILVPPRDGTSLHPDEPKKALRAIHERNPIHTVVMDMTRAEEVAAFCRDELGAEVIDHSQGNAQAALDFERFMDALRVGWIRHTGDAGLARHVLNAVARELPDKKAKFERPAATRQNRDRFAQEARVIDALDAAAMVHSEAAIEMAGQEEESWADSSVTDR
ncbi:MAG: terminase large subunit [Gemmatimonadaceae bacterium]|nr:terminase large subunit [Gemmatimonadaceae bacterium]